MFLTLTESVSMPPSAPCVLRFATDRAGTVRHECPANRVARSPRRQGPSTNKLQNHFGASVRRGSWPSARSSNPTPPLEPQSARRLRGSVRRFNARVWGYHPRLRAEVKRQRAGGGTGTRASLAWVRILREPASQDNVRGILRRTHSANRAGAFVSGRTCRMEAPGRQRRRRRPSPSVPHARTPVPSRMIKRAIRSSHNQRDLFVGSL